MDWKEFLFHFVIRLQGLPKTKDFLFPLRLTLAVYATLYMEYAVLRNLKIFSTSQYWVVYVLPLAPISSTMGEVQEQHKSGTFHVAKHRNWYCNLNKSPALS
jgi:hypothetical protein